MQVNANASNSTANVECDALLVAEGHVIIADVVIRIGIRTRIVVHELNRLIELQMEGSVG